ncbi:amidase [Sneathiella glossodoripedis]|uniref:amidase n=1 Tax=Sneathiella glossodoripedis TaxID=418853 RepID=UPI000559E94B|nr:amidase family protein [Sneathiella glossodoripedis]
MFEDYDQYDGLGLAELVRRKEVSAPELLESAIARTEMLNPALNAVVYRMYEEARRYVRQELPTEGPFSGVPFLLKDLIATYKGTPTSGSCKILQDVAADEDSELVKRLKKAGVVIFGKTNTPEFGIMGITEPKLRGASRNPWDQERSTGGSSGGSAAAVAAGLVPMAHGGDGGGSIRIPSSHCGTVGLLPSRGRNPLGPTMGEAWGGLAREHVISRSVRDSAAMLDCLRGVDAGAPYGAPNGSAVPFLKACEPSKQRFKVAYSLEPLYGQEAHSDCREAVQKVADHLRELGHEVVEDRPRINRHKLARSYLLIVCAWVAWELRQSASMAGRPLVSDDFELTSWIMGQVGEKNSMLDLADAVHANHEAARLMGRFHEKYDLLLTATTAQPPAKIGELYPHGKDEAALKLLKFLPAKVLLNKALDSLAEEALAATPNTQLFNQTGQPAISLPLHWNEAGLPIGVQFAAEFGNEWALYTIASELERSMPWKARRPELQKAT